MAEDYVKRDEFNSLKKEVNTIKDEIAKNNEKVSEILVNIDKKTDIIAEKLKNTNELNELKKINIEEKINTKFFPLECKVKENEREVNKLREDKNKLFWTLMGEFIGLIIVAIQVAIKLK